MLTSVHRPLWWDIVINSNEEGMEDVSSGELEGYKEQFKSLARESLDFLREALVSDIYIYMYIYICTHNSLYIFMNVLSIKICLY